MIALFVGRFQPFHLGHLRVIKEILEENSSIIIVIGSSQANGTEKNPFSFEERKEMVNNALRSEGISNFEIHPVRDFNDDKLWTDSIKKIAKFDAVYSQNDWTISCFEKNGAKVKKHSLYDHNIYSGSNIRKRIREGKGWEHLVPETVADLVKEFNGVERIRKNQ
jgi:nicotinamide-nucleotide adenylyltransferase